MLQFGILRVNLLDTPGHKDFLRTPIVVLTAVDLVIMVIDAGRSRKLQTRKLFEVCASGVPIFTFMNKMDRLPGPDGLWTNWRSWGSGQAGMNWPLGSGVEFRGVYDRAAREVHLFERSVGGKYRAVVNVTGLRIPWFGGALDEAFTGRCVSRLK